MSRGKTRVLFSAGEERRGEESRVKERKEEEPEMRTGGNRRIEGWQLKREDNT